MTGTPDSQLPQIERAPLPAPAMRAVVLASLAASMLALFLFSWLAEQVFQHHAHRFDDSVRAFVHQFSSPAMTRAMVVTSMLGSEVLAAAFVVALIIFVRMRWRRAALWLVVSMAGGLLLNVTLKYTFHRARPVPFFGALPHSYSFPSGHSLMSFCLYAVLAGLLSRRIHSSALQVTVWMVAALLILLIGLSRVYLGVHYPTDVLAGYAAAAVWVTALLTADRFRKHRQRRRS